jgi:hypothetical protein
MSAAPVKLEYAPPPSWHRRRWFRRTVLLVCVFAIAAAGWRWAPEKWQRAKLLYWQRQCLNYSPSADEVVYDQEPGGAPLLLYKPGYQKWSRGGFEGGTLATASKVPECYRRFQEEESGTTYVMQNPVLFLHERRALSGRRYLVVVTGDDFFQAWDTIDQLDIHTRGSFTVGGWSDYPQHTGGLLAMSAILPPPRKPHTLRVFAGQADPENESHFTIRYEVDGRSNSIDGYVQDFQLGPQTTLFGAAVLHVRFIDRSQPIPVESP